MNTTNNNNGGGSDFRSTAYYNNIIYSLVGHVIEKLAATGAWEDVMSEMVFAPLNMTETCFYHDCSEPEEEMAQHYIHYPDVDGKMLSLVFDHSLIRYVRSFFSAKITV